MAKDLREHACWLALVFESGLTIRVVNDILVIWCKQLSRTLQDFFAADIQEWEATCQLNAKIIEKLKQAKEKLVAQAFLVEQLEHAHIHFVTVLDPEYPQSLKSALGRSHLPPVLFFMGDIDMLKRQTIAIIGSRNAGDASLEFTRAVAGYLAEHDINIISGYARGVDRAAYEGAVSIDGCTTVVLPHGIRKLSKVKMHDLQLKIELGKILLLSQFHPDSPWLVSRAMERNGVVTGLAQVIIVAESDIKGGTWEGANGALKQKQGRRLYVRKSEPLDAYPGNKLLLERGGHPLDWPVKHLADILAPLLPESEVIRAKQSMNCAPSSQHSLLALQAE
jgi:DNA protecting protein DprA